MHEKAGTEVIGETGAAAGPEAAGQIRPETGQPVPEEGIALKKYPAYK